MWEDIKADNGPNLRRIAVPGGWLYGTWLSGSSTAAYVFVPQPAEQGDKVKPTEDDPDYDDPDYDDQGNLRPGVDHGDKVKPSDLASLLRRAARYVEGNTPMTATKACDLAHELREMARKVER